MSAIIIDNTEFTLGADIYVIDESGGTTYVTTVRTEYESLSSAVGKVLEEYKVEKIMLRGVISEEEMNQIRYLSILGQTELQIIER